MSFESIRCIYHATVRMQIPTDFCNSNGHDLGETFIAFSVQLLMNVKTLWKLMSRFDPNTIKCGERIDEMVENDLKITMKRKLFEIFIDESSVTAT